MNKTQIPFKQDLTLAYGISLVIALLMTTASIVGVLFQASIYPASQRAGNVGTDALNLVVGLPMLLGSMWWTRRGSLIGLLCWPGALLYLLYIYVFFLIGVPFNALFLVYLTLAALCAYTLIGFVASIDGDAVRQRFSAGTPARIIGGVLVAFALLFIARTAAAVVTAFTSHAAVDSMVFASWISDCAVQCPALIAGGILLWRHKALGYVAGVGLLLQLGVLFAGLPVSLVVGALLTGSPVDANSAVILPFGVILFILLVIFIRSAAPGRSPSPAS